MSFPKQERFTISDLAKKWKKSETYIVELLSKEEFPYIIQEGELIGGHQITRHIYFSRASWPYGDVTYKELGPQEIASLLERDEGQDWLRSYVERCEPWWKDKTAIFYIPSESVEFVKTKYGSQQASTAKGAKPPQANTVDLLPGDKTYSVQAAAAYLGVSKSTLYRWDADEVLKPSRTHGQHRRYAKSDLDRIKQKKESQT